MFLAGVTLMAGGPLGQQPSGNGPCFSLSGSQNSPRGVLPALRLQSPGDGSPGDGRPDLRRLPLSMRKANPARLVARKSALAFAAQWKRT